MKTLRLLLVFLSFPLVVSASERELRGDWGSAGDEPRPYNPKYEFLYKCQAELTDFVDRVGDGKEVPSGKPYRLYAVWHFELANGNVYWEAKGKARWIAKLLEEEEMNNDLLVLKGTPAQAFPTEEMGNAHLSFEQRQGQGKDRVVLFSSVTLPVDKYLVSDSSLEKSYRGSGVVAVRAEVSATASKGQGDSLRRDLYVHCEKKK